MPRCIQPQARPNCGARERTLSVALRVSGGRLLPPTARYLRRRPSASGTWNTMDSASHGLAPSSYESVNRLRLTPMSHGYSGYSSPDFDCSLGRWRNIPSPKMSAVSSSSRSSVPLVVLIFFIAGLLYLLCFEHVDNLGAYTASRPETGLLIPSDFVS